MALIKCTECGWEFSDKAHHCPSCGCPTEFVLDELKNFTYGSSTLRVEKVFDITGRGIAVNGIVEGGPLKVGDMVSWQLKGNVWSTNIVQIMKNRQTVTVANAGDQIDILFKNVNILHIEPGCIISL